MITAITAYGISTKMEGLMDMIDHLIIQECNLGKFEVHIDIGKGTRHTELSKLSWLYRQEMIKSLEQRGFRFEPTGQSLISIYWKHLE